MPFINYELGDDVIMNKSVNPSHYNGQVISKVLGRSSDIIELENGNIITGPGFTILFKDLPVDYYRIEKTGPNYISCYIKKLKSYNNEHESIIISNFEKHIGSANFSLIYTKKILLSNSGKRKYFLSK
jgi:phenylacetate-CoA ligase